MMANSPNVFKPCTTPIEECTAVRVCVQSCKPKGSRARGIRVARLLRELKLAAQTSPLDQNDAKWSQRTGGPEPFGS